MIIKWLKYIVRQLIRIIIVLFMATKENKEATSMIIFIDVASYTISFSNGLYLI